MLVETEVYLPGFGLVVRTAEKTVIPVVPTIRRLVVVVCHLRYPVALVVVVKSSDGAESLVEQKVLATDFLSNQATGDQRTLTDNVDDDVVVRRYSVDCVLRLGVTGRLCQ
jgi:hypothetical protein